MRVHGRCVALPLIWSRLGVRVNVSLAIEIGCQGGSSGGEDHIDAGVSCRVPVIDFVDVVTWLASQLEELDMESTDVFSTACH